MSIEELLRSVYNQADTEVILKGIAELTRSYQSKVDSKRQRLNEKDIVLITYGDQVYRDNEYSLVTLKRFLDNDLKDLINAVHILPFYPYSSDDGFSVIDYYEVNPDLGRWEHIEEMAADGYKIMFDAVINHISQHSDWFKGFLENKQDYAGYFIEEASLDGWQDVVRPRTSPLLHEFEGVDSQIKNVWTTFSRDQVDLNYKNPQVLLHIMDLLLFYVSKGAKLLRLDAIGFMWKEKDTTSIHLDQTHNIIKVMRSVIESISPSVVLVTETNVPHLENISYFGNGRDEAHMVYNFTLPPLMAHGLLTENTKRLTDWAQSLELPGKDVCFFNFAASHDGVGLRPLDGLVSDNDLDVLLASAKANKGFVSYKSNADGSQSPYEINCNYYDLLKGEEVDADLGARRLVLSQALLMAMPGVPGLYFHSLVGSENYLKGVEETGRNRTINREKLSYDTLVSQLNDPEDKRHEIFEGIKHFIDIRKSNACFDPFGEFSFPAINDQVFVILRQSSVTRTEVTCFFNFSGKTQQIQLPQASGVNLISGNALDQESYILAPYEVLWVETKMG